MAVTSIANKLKSGSLLVGNSYYVPPSYESIATVTVGAGGSSTISFSSIPSTFKHLELRWIGRTTVASTGMDGLDIRFNSDSGTNYSDHRLLGNGSAASAASWVSNNSILLTTGLVRGNEASGLFGTGVLSLLDYQNTNKYKTTRTLTGCDLNGSGEIILMSGSWMNTSAVTSITITAESSHTFAQYSQFALYGVKG